MSHALRKVVTFASLALGIALLTASCKDGDKADTSGPDGSASLKIICKLNNQCWVCPTQDAMKKCLINPVTSGCKLGSSGDCS